MSDENMTATDSRATADDLREKVHELFARTMGNLDPQLDKIIKSDCGIVKDHEELGGYAVAKLFLMAFLREEADRQSIQIYSNPRYDEIDNNYWRFLV